MPAGLRERVLVFCQHHAEGVAEAALVVLVQQEAGHVAQRQSPEAANRGVRLEAVAQHALRVVEIQVLDDRSIAHAQRFRTRSDERRVGNEGVSTSSSWWCHYN